MIQQLTSPTDMRRINRQALLEVIWGEAIMTAAELVEGSGLTRATVYAACDELIAQGWIVELDRQRAPNEARGRPSRRFQFAYDSGAVVAIDAGSHSVRVAVTNLTGRLRATKETPLAGDTQDMSDRQERVRSTVRAALQEAKTSPELVVCATLAIPAPVNANGCVPEKNAFWRLMHADLPGILNDLLQAPVLVENDANLAAFAEFAQRFSPEDNRGPRDLLAVLSGWRTQSGIISDGHLIRGSRGRAGESSGLTLVKGVNNTIGAYRWIAEDAARLLKESSTPSLMRVRGDTELTSEYVLGLSKQSDPVAMKAVEHAGRRLGRILATQIALLDPEVAVVCGSAVPLAKETMPFLHAEVARVVGIDNVPVIECSALGSDVVLVGAIARSLEHIRSHTEDIIIAERPEQDALPQ
ncbi:MAG: ROK family transcriptional regulator [Ancrocorticia sp.]